MREREIIDNYRDLPYGRYEEIVRLCETPMTDVDRKVAVVAVLTGKTEDEVLHLPLEQFTRYSGATRFLEKPCPDDLMPAVMKSYPVGRFVLLPVTDIRKITTAQYVDFQTFAADKEHRAVEMLSCFMVPRGKEYNEGYDVTEVHAAMRDGLSVADVLALLAFFFRSWAESIRATLTCSIRTAKTIKDRRTRAEALGMIRGVMDSWTGGDGSPTSTG